jgi:hypothetical protein
VFSPKLGDKGASSRGYAADRDGLLTGKNAMNKFGLILAGAVMFDLGTVVVSSHAAIDSFLKLGTLKGEMLTIKMDKVEDKSLCKTHGGTLIKSDGVEYCNIPATGPVHDDVKQNKGS